MRISIKRRLWLGFLANLFVLPIVFALMFWSMGDSEANFVRTAAVLDQVRAAEQIRHQLDGLGTGESRARVAAEIALRDLAGRLGGDDRGQAAQSARALSGTVLAAAEALRREEPPPTEALRAQLSTFAAAGWRLYDDNQAELWQIKRRTTTSFLALVPLAVAMAILASFLISRSILRPLSEITRASQRMAEGDLREGVPVPPDEELRILAEGFNRMRERLAGLFVRLRSHAREVSEVAEAVRTAAAEMTHGAQQQSAASEETSSAMEEIAAQIQGVSRNAVELANDTTVATSSAKQIGAAADSVLRGAQDLQAALDRSGNTVDEMATTAQQSSTDLGAVDRFAREINSEAESGGAALDASIERILAVGEASRESSAAFDRLAGRSRQITGIVETMAEIADQTNLLALNAAIEAARAGDSGRGFAVVAEEVRKLAERAVGAAKEVGVLVAAVREETESAVHLAKQNASKTEEGARLLNDTGARVRRVIESVRRAGELVSKVTSAVAAQSRSASELKKEVERLRGLSGVLSQSAAAQATGSLEVVGAMERMSARTRQVADATVQVRSGGDQVLKAVEDISAAARQNHEGVQSVTRAMQSLTTKVSELHSHAAVLRVEEATS